MKIEITGLGYQEQQNIEIVDLINGGLTIRILAENANGEVECHDIWNEWDGVVAPKGPLKPSKRPDPAPIEYEGAHYLGPKTLERLKACDGK